jgi:hypothetical protein
VKPIATVASLRAHIQEAIELEHATIPPYFTAWLSMKEGSNFEAAEMIRSVMLEEMLHLTLAANLLNAVGGKPSLTHRGFVPNYPHALPHGGRRFKVGIERFSKRALETFLKIERPEAKGARPQPGHFKTIGQFYDAVRDGVDRLCDRFGEQRVFTGDPARQIRPEDYYASGAVVVVTGRDSAHRAMDEIVEQGEGADKGIFDKDRQILGDGDGRELAHYFRFMQVLEGRRFTRRDTPASGPTGSRMPVDYDAVYPIQPNARASRYAKGSAIRAALEAFGKSYEQLLAALEAAFNGNRGRLTEAMARMFALRDQARALMQTPSGDGRTTVGLDFRPRI